MHIDWWTLALQCINAMVLIWLLARFLFKPVSNIIAQRQTSVATLMGEAQQAKDAALREQQKAETELAQIADQRAQRLDAASAEAQMLKASLEQDARQQAQQMRDTAHADIERMRSDATRADAARATCFAIDITAKLLDRMPTQARVAGFIEGLANKLAELPESSLAAMRRNGDEASDGDAPPLQLIAPRALRAEELSACQEAIAKALGTQAVLNVRVDPSLLAGLELETPHALVRNSLRNDLERLKSELLAHDEHRE